MIQTFKTTAMPDRTPSLVVAVLAGGESRRMGQDKALIKYEGLPLLGRVCGAATAAGLAVAVIGRTKVQLPEALQPMIRAVPDDQPGLGPLGGLDTAFKSFPEADAILLCACDLPLITTEAFNWLVSCTVEPQGGATGTRETHGIIPVRNNQPEPLFAVYYRNSSHLVRHQIDTGSRSLRALISAGTFRHIVLPSRFQSAAKDIDTPADLHRLNIKQDSEI